MNNKSKFGGLLALLLGVGMTTVSPGATGATEQAPVAPTVNLANFSRRYQTQRVVEGCEELGVEFKVVGAFVYVKPDGLTNEQLQALERMGFAIVGNKDSPNVGNLFHPGPKLNPEHGQEIGWRRGSGAPATPGAGSN